MGALKTYLFSFFQIAISDPTSIAGRPGLVDQAQFARASQAIHQGCAALSSPSSPQKQVLDAATLIAKHTSALCNSCRVASAKTSNPVAKRQFVQSAKAVANSTSALVKQIKALDLSYSEENRRNCADATAPLLGIYFLLLRGYYLGLICFFSRRCKQPVRLRKFQRVCQHSGQNLASSSSFSATDLGASK